MNINWIRYQDNYVKWMTDWNENIFAIKNFGQPFKINSSLSIYNQDTTKTRKENKNYKEMINFLVKKFNE